MDRIIEVKVNGNYLTKDNRYAGVQREANMTTLRIEFDEGWDGFAKHITWWDATGENPVEIVLGVDRLEDVAQSTRIYLVTIPAEPLMESGECSFVIDGYIDGKKQRSIEDHLTVIEANYTEEAGEPADPTPTQAEQLQAEIEAITKEVHEAAKATQSIMDMTVEAEMLAQGSEATVEKTEDEGGALKLIFGLPEGRQGETGPQGPEGPQGPQGEIGPRGETGPQGERGPQGDRGERGPHGPQGIQGVQGQRGIQGPKGDIGPQGAVGPRGPQGVQGPAGPQGVAGVAVQTTGYVNFSVSEDGILQCTYTGDEAPAYSINEDGHLILTV